MSELYEATTKQLFQLLQLSHKEVKLYPLFIETTEFDDEH